ncbi:MAG TPA: peptide ligase PGM1-related protein, partial [Xanthobacteraceae bacterium]|nr:peptide ligase PGM1-related protein [Xanthobacteraceae bacterium]
DPALQVLGTKSGGRQALREAGVAIPDGVEDLADEAGIAAGLAELKGRNPDLRRAVVKLNEGFSGEGNALFRFDGAPGGPARAAWIRERLPDLAFEAHGMTWEAYRAKVRQMGAIVEAFIEGDEKRSPSVQFRIDPLGTVEPVSTHDQVLGGPGGQIFLGCRFPANEAYRGAIQSEGAKVAALLRERGVLGRFGVDFVATRHGDTWRTYAIEINLRKGGTTHPFLMLQFLTGGAYDPATGLFRTPAGQPRFYYASDNLEAPHYRGLTPPDLVDVAVLNGLHYDGTMHEGVVFHLIGALSEFGKLGVVCVGASPERAEALYRRTVEILDREQKAGL